MVIVLSRGTCAHPRGDVVGGVLHPHEYLDLPVPLNPPIPGEPAAGHAPEGAPPGYSQQYHYNSYG